MMLSAVALSIVGFAGPADALVSITVPPSTVNLGSTSVNNATFSAQLGTVTASDTLGATLTVTVSTTVFTTGGGTANETIGKSQIFYWSGAATTSSGLSGSTP